MNKDRVIKDLTNMIAVVEISPELFNDGIDEEIIAVLDEALKFIEKN